MNAQPQRHLYSVPSGDDADTPLWLQVANAATAARPRDHAATLRLFKVLIDYMPTDDPRTLYYLGHAYLRAGNPMAAASFLEFALKKGLPSPNRGRARLELASALRQIDHVAEALECLDSGMDDPASSAFADALAAYKIVILHDSGQHRTAAHTAVFRLAPHLGRLVDDPLP